MAIASQFGTHSTAREVASGHNLNGRTMIVTGGSGGLGLEAVKALHEAGATVIATARDVRRAAATLAQSGLSDVAVEALDLSSLGSIRAFAGRWGARPLDVLINNAGIMNVPEGRTEDGFESHIGVNHLAHFLLSVLLTPALRQGVDSRVVSVSSAAHRLAPWNEEDPHGRIRGYDPRVAYGESKAANALFALAYDDQFASEGIRAFSLMPGVIETPLMAHVSNDDRTALLERMRHVVKTPEQGASTIVWAAIAPELAQAGGLYLENCHEAEPTDLAVPGIGVAAHVQDHEAAARLWKWSEGEVGLPAS